MEIFLNVIADAGAGLLILLSAFFAAIFLSLVVMFLLPTTGELSKKNIGGLLLRMFSISALLKMAGVTAVKAVIVTIVVTVLYLAAFGWAGKRAVDIVTGNSTYVVRPVETAQQ